MKCPRCSQALSSDVDVACRHCGFVRLDFAQVVETEMEFAYEEINRHHHRLGEASDFPPDHPTFGCAMPNSCDVKIDIPARDQDRFATAFQRAMEMATGMPKTGQITGLAPDVVVGHHPADKDLVALRAEVEKLRRDNDGLRDWIVKCEFVEKENERLKAERGTFFDDSNRKAANLRRHNEGLMKQIEELYGVIDRQRKDLRRYEYEARGGSAVAQATAYRPGPTVYCQSEEDI